MKKRCTLIFVVKKFNGQSEYDSWIPGKRCENNLTESAVLFPSAQTIQRIFDFARAYDVMETKTAGQIEMILN